MKPKSPEIEIARGHGWVQGAAYVIAELTRWNTNPQAILECIGITAEELKRAKVDPFDANPVRKLLRQIEKGKS